MERVEFNGNLGGQSCFITGRDENGLPIFKMRDSNGDNAPKVFAGSSNSRTQEGAGVKKRFTNMSEGISGAKNTIGEEVKEEGEVPKEDKNVRSEDLPSKASGRSWVNVIKSDPVPNANIKFDYRPLPMGVEVVEPPEEVLLKGAEKYKCSIEGQFTRGALPFLKVQSIAKVAWGEKGFGSSLSKEQYPICL